MIADIKHIEDVKIFFKDLINEGVNAHPDEDFLNYVHITSGHETYSPDEAEKRNILMRKSFKVCGNIGIDIYDLMQAIYDENSNLWYDTD